MISLLFSRGRIPGAKIAALYGAIVAQARRPVFYEAYGVPDTVEGRFDMIVLHLFLFLRQVRTDQVAAPLAQPLFDRFCRDMDHNLREMGVSDLAVPRHMRSIGEAFYGRAAAYDAALAESGPEPLTNALGRNIFRDAAAASGGAPRLAAYVQAAVAMHRDAGTGSEPAFPDPEVIETPR